MSHFASPEFWFHHRQLPEPIRELADKNFQLLKANPRHPSTDSRKLAAFGRRVSGFITAPSARIIPTASSGIGSDPTEDTIKLPDSEGPRTLLTQRWNEPDGGVVVAIVAAPGSVLLAWASDRVPSLDSR